MTTTMTTTKTTVMMMMMVMVMMMIMTTTMSTTTMMMSMSSRIFFCDKSTVFVTISNFTVKSKLARWRLKSLASPLFTQPFIQTQTKENIKTSGHWPLCGEFPGDRRIPRVSNAENVSIRWRHHIKNLTSNLSRSNSLLTEKLTTELY